MLREDRPLPLSISNSAHPRTQHQSSLSRRGLQADRAQLPTDGFFPEYSDPACTPPGKDRMWCLRESAVSSVGQGLLVGNGCLPVTSIRGSQPRCLGLTLLSAAL